MPSDNARWVPRPRWENYHETIERPIKGVFIERYVDGSPAFSLENARICAAAVAEDVKAARAAGMPARAVGRGWSLSDVPVVDGALFDLARQWGMMPLRAEHIDPACPAAWRDGLWLIQAGAYISEINRVIERDTHRRTMPTTGAANGQTIAGAFSAGTHGSLNGVGAIHDYVAAIHLILPDARQVWIERTDRPVAAPGVAEAVGAELVRDTDLFRAVQLGLGAFGIIANVVLKTRPRVMLDAYNLVQGFDGQPLRFDARMRHVIETLDIHSHPGLRRPGAAAPPDFFQPIIDLNNPDGDVLVTLIYEHDWKPGHVPDYGLAETGMGPGCDVISCLGPLLDTFDAAVPLVSQLLSNQLFKPGAKLDKSWGEIFGYKAPRTKVASGSVAVPIERANETLDCLIALNARVGPAPLVLGGRYVWKSDALLAMNKWDRSFVVSVDGIWNRKATKYFDAIPAAMEQANIPFTQHWGKHNGYNDSRVRTAFGANRTKWIAARHALIPDAADRDRFANPYMRDRGLDE